MSAADGDSAAADADQPSPLAGRAASADSDPADAAGSDGAAEPDGRTRRPGGGALRVVHCPVNTAGVPWTNVQALRQRGVDSSLVVFNRYAMHPEADWSLDRHGNLLRRQLTQWRALARLLPRTDVFHFYFGLTLVPKPLQFRILRLFGKKSVFHYLGSDIRGKTPEDLAFGKQAGAEIVGSYDAIRWVPEAHVIPPGIDVARITPSYPARRERPLIIHAPSSRARKGTDVLIAACEGLDADLEIVEGLHHADAFERYREADIVVDQLNAGWYGLFAIECMALGKPVVTYLHDEAVQRTEEAYGVAVPLVNASKETLRDRLEELVAMDVDERRRIGEASRAYVERVHDLEQITDRFLDVYAGLELRAGVPLPTPAPIASPIEGGPAAAALPAPPTVEGLQDPAESVIGPPAPVPTATLAGRLRRLGRHSAIYGLGGLVSRVLAVILLPLYTHYLSPGDYGRIATLAALVIVLTIILRLGITSAFFRFYFDSTEREHRLEVLRTSFWFTMGVATVGLIGLVGLSKPIASLLFGDSSDWKLVAASGVALWAQTNYEQLTALFRVEERAGAFVAASVTNILITVGATLILVVGLEQGPLGVIVGNFTGTLIVYLSLLGYRREQLGLSFDRVLLREMNRFGLPLVPAAMFMWVTNFSDRFLLGQWADQHEVGLYSVGVQISSAMVLLLTAFRTAWPAFAYSIESDAEASETYGWVLTYLTLVTSWIATALGLLSPWIVTVLAESEFAPASRVVAPLAFASVALGGYIVVSIGVGRSRRTGFNWVVTLAAALVNFVLNVILIPPYGMMGAAVATVAAYTVMFAAMAWWSKRLYPIVYQWRRVLTATGLGVVLVVAGKLAEVGLPVAVVLSLAYPVLLLALGFYLPAERRAIARKLRLTR
jgi:O-antigen/teichoic acid export membrane protein/glycosyltransferase involved in cell wall biosynthesis